MWVRNVQCLAAVAVVLCLPNYSNGDALFVLSAPNLLRVGSNENIFVESQDHTGGDLDVKIIVKNHPNQNKELVSKTVKLNSANDFQALTQLVIPEGDHFSDDTKQKQYVVLQAHFPGRILEKVVLVSFQSGYIFIQTDKTIYTPASTVYYRVFSMSPSLEPLTRVIFQDKEIADRKEIAVSVEIMTPENITIFREIVNPDKGVKSGQFKLPEIVNFGTWHVVTRFQRTPQKTFSSDFEVKEYVLPSFEVRLTPSKAFFYVDQDVLTVDITAKYLYGKDVSGTAYVVFGVITTDNEKKSFPGSVQRVQIIDSKGEARLTKEHIKQTFNDINILVKQSIYVSVSVLTESGGEMVEAERRGIEIVTSPYTILFKRTPKYFKPGMPFDVSVFVTNPDNSPASGVEIEVAPDKAKGITRANGFAKVTLNTVSLATNLKITVKIRDPNLLDNRQAEASITALPYQTATKNFLHIGVDSNELKIGDPIKINLNLGHVAIQNHDLTYMFLSRGQLVKVGRFKRQGNALVTLTIPVSKEMLPSFRIVAYYHVGTADLVADSVWVDVKVSCMGTLEVKTTVPKASYEPRKAFSLTITGDPGAKVGLVAVDKGVYVLNNKHRLTQTKIWETIEKHDTGCTAGGGANSMGVFYDAGLVMETNTAKGTGIRTDPSCPVTARRRRAVTISEVITTMTSSENIMSRSQFPESWMWEDLILPECPANDKNCATRSITRNYLLKHSITTWQVTAISLSKTHGICVANPLELIVSKEFFIDLKLPYSAVRNEQLEVKAILHNYSEDPITVRVELIENGEVCSSASKKGRYRQEVNMDPMSTRVVPYVIVPMTLGMHSIKVNAAVKKYGSNDSVRKDLRVVSEGVLVKKTNNVLLNPAEHGGEQTVHIPSGVPRNQVPNSNADTLISVTDMDLKDVNLNINIEVAGRASVTKWSINNKNQFHTRTDKVNSIDKDLIVRASGNGEATVSVVTLYYALPEVDASDCTSFDLTVTLTQEDKTSHEDAKESFMLTIEMLYRNNERDATMSILDIGLLTGFIVDTEDLKQLSRGRERYIEKFEMDRVLTERGSLIIYLDKVSHKLADKISFKIHRVQDVGVLQPAAVSIYEYYNQKACMKFYHPKREGGTLSRLCLGDVCKCAEESCTMQRINEPDVKRIDKACDAGLDFVYKATVVDMKLTPHADTYTLKINEVIKPGSDEEVLGRNRDFIGLSYCREAVGLKQGKTYMIMGKSADMHKVEEDGKLIYKYVLGEKTWIEYWPTESECTAVVYREICLGIDEFNNQMSTFGCPV